jgi:hypothetical protein
MDERELSEELKDEIILELYAGERVREVTQEDIRKVLLTAPNQAVVYIKFARTQMRNSIINSAQFVKNDIEFGKISYPEIKTILAHSEHNWNYLTELFSLC